MAIREILLLGNEALYNTSIPVKSNELDKAKRVVEDLHDTLLNFNEKYGFGRAIAAPQIGEFLRIIYMNFVDKSYAFINPRLKFGKEMFQIWDDCMSFPGLEIKVNRFKNTKLLYKDLLWNDYTLECKNDLSELIQHEYDHLDGILAVQRAIDNKSLRINKAKVTCF